MFSVLNVLREVKETEVEAAGKLRFIPSKRLDHDVGSLRILFVLIGPK